SPKAAPQSLIKTPPVPQDEDEREPMFIQPHDPEYVPEPMYHEYILLEDENVLPTEEQPLPPVVSPTTEGDGGDDDDNDSSEDDVDDDDDEDEEEEEDEHLALANSAVVVPTVELVSPPEGTEPIIPPSSTDITTTGARITTLRIASTQALIDAVTAILPSPPLPPLPLPLYIPPPVDRRNDIPETELPPHKKACLFGRVILLDRPEVER
nr:hypothetical protein [Tanacetum cinerariifolium]